ncbi:FG-GAP repeat protein [candidate division KSB1 bacterium]|nr:FG-GAP repeat protein [candidate division KSB1 bacterium]
MKHAFILLSALLVLGPGYSQGISTVTPPATATFAGENAGDQSGHHVSIIGDINNDNYDDFIITAPLWDANTTSQNGGSVYLFYGRSAGFSGAIDLSSADARFIGDHGQEAAHDAFGIGDIDNDGYVDFAIGIKKYSAVVDGIAQAKAGKVYLFFGGTTKYSGIIPLESAIASLEGTVKDAEAAHVKGVGDVNGDGYDDIIIGAGFHPQVGAEAGKVYLFFGKERAAWLANVKMEDAADASFLAEAAGDWAGHRVAGVGDANGDGLADFIIGANYADANGLTNCGKVYLVLGKEAGWELNAPLSGADASWIGQARAGLGWNVARPGDVDGDGRDDILIGSSKYTAYLILGKNLSLMQDQSINSAADVTFTPPPGLNDGIGYDMHSLGDLNGDSYDDFLIGISEFTDEVLGARAGKVFGFYGRPDWPTQLAFAEADLLFGAENGGDAFGFAVAGDGDVNNDGLADLLISALQNDDNGTDAGKTYLYLSGEQPFTLLAPNGGEMLDAGSSFTIRWTGAEADDHIRLELSVDGGVTWDAIAADAENSGAFAWNVPDRSTSLALVRVTRIKSDHSKVSDSSNAPFTISGSAFTRQRIEAEYAQLSEGYVVENRAESSNGQVVQIETAATGRITCFVDLPPADYDLYVRYLDETDGNSTSAIYINSAQVAEWTWDDVVAADVAFYQHIGAFTLAQGDTVELRAARNGGEHARVDYFEFVSANGAEQSITLLSPNGGENWPIDSAQDITWTAEYSSPAFNLQLSRDDGATWTDIASAVAPEPQAGVYSYRIERVSGPISAACLIKVTDADGAPMDRSDASFQITESLAPVITVTKPNGGETWMTGQIETITWESKNSGDAVSIELSRNAGSSWSVLTESTANDGEFDWQVTIPPSDDCLIRISDVTSTAADSSDGLFRIKGTPKLTVNAPNGGETWCIGATERIRWSAEFVAGTIRIDISRDGGGSWQAIAEETSNDGAHDWLVTAPETPSALVRVAAVDGSAADTSDAIFTIAAPPSITVTSPNGGEKWQIGMRYGITWTSVNSSGSVSVALSRDNGATWDVLSDSTQDTGDYSWTVTPPTSDACLVMVSDVSEAVWDVSNAVFAILPATQPTITVTAPNGGENWAIGSPQTITWFSQDVESDMKIELSRDNGASWEMLAPAVADSGSYHWTPTAPATDAALVRVSAVDNSATDVSDATFRISDKPAITIMAPNGEEKWQIGTAQVITWTSVNTSGAVKIQLTRDNGATWETIAQSEDTGSYTWLVTGPASHTCLVMVADVSGTPLDTSNSSFTILEQPAIELTSPNGGETWRIGDEQVILWESTNGGSLIKIELSRDNGATWTQLVGDAANSGSWTWIAQAPTSESCLVRITDVTKVISDKSDAVFRVDYPTGVARINDEVPVDFALQQNYPNPFNPVTRIQYQLAARSHVRFAIYNIHGSEIATLVDETQDAGTYVLGWHGLDENGAAVPSGVYFYRMTTDSFTEARRMILMK